MISTEVLTNKRKYVNTKISVCKVSIQHKVKFYYIKWMHLEQIG